jgi:hypothetical protein
MAATYAHQHADMQQVMTDADIANAEERINELSISASQSDRDRVPELQRNLERVRANMVTIAARHTEAYIGFEGSSGLLADNICIYKSHRQS